MSITDEFADQNSSFEQAEANWQKEMARALGKKTPDILTRRTQDGLVIGPISTIQQNPQIEGAPGQFPFVRGPNSKPQSHQKWDIRQPIATGEPERANRHALQELTGGASSLHLSIDPSAKSGIAIRELADLDVVLHGVDLEIAGLGFEPSIYTADISGIMLAHLERQKTDLDKTNIHFGFSPIGQSAKHALNHNYLQNALEEATQLACWSADNAPHFTSLTLSSDLIHEAGGSPALELAWICAETVEYMKVLLAAGLSVDQTAGQMVASIAMDANLHLGIAKLRAARRVWASVMQNCDASEAACCLKIQAQASNRMLTRREPWVNILRISTASFGAVLGGAQIISTVPFTHVSGAPNELARRLARNTQMVLQEECAAGQVIDPSGGSHFHERMTDQLAHAAWKLFQEIEQQGGLLTALENQWLQKTIVKQQKHRQQKIQTRKQTMIGVSDFANLDETIAPVAGHNWQPKPHNSRPQFPVSLPIKERITQAKDGTMFAGFEPEGTTAPNPFAPQRDSDQFELLRDAAENQTQNIFLASMGTIADSAPRAGFTRNLMAAGGVQTTDNMAWETENSMLGTFVKSGAKLAILCGPDALYAENAENWASQLKAEGAEQVWIAGGLDLPHNSKLDRRFAAGCNAVEVLQAAHACLGIKHA